MLENIKSALQAIMINKVRAFLTMLGVIIGVFSVVTLSAIGNGVTVYINDQFETLGSNSLYIEPIKIDGGQEEQMTSLTGPPAGLSRSIEKEVLSFKQYVAALSPMQSGSGSLSYRGQKIMGVLVGVNENGINLVGMRVALGRDFTKADVRDKKNYVILGSQIAKDLFGDIAPLNKKIKINERTFQVIGITEEKGSGGGMAAQFDKMVILPIDQVLDFTGSTTVSEYVVKVHSKDLMPAAKEALQARLREIVKDEQVSVIDQAQIMSMVDSIMGVLTIGLSGIAAISLLVGGIGIMNIMLVSVTERTREIGLRKALGATPNTIMGQFLFEALFLSVTGGMLGVTFAWLTTLAIQHLFPAQVKLDSVVLAFSVSLIVGLVFGVLPARRAAKLSPIEALRYE